MAATQILPIASTAADSTDVTVAAGATLTVCLKDSTGGQFTADTVVQILLKGDNSQYFKVDTLTKDKPAVVIVGAGVYRFRRLAGGSCGVFSG